MLQEGGLQSRSCSIAPADRRVPKNRSTIPMAGKQGRKAKKSSSEGTGPDRRLLTAAVLFYAIVVSSWCASDPDSRAIIASWPLPWPPTPPPAACRRQQSAVAPPACPPPPTHSASRLSPLASCLPQYGLTSYFFREVPTLLPADAAPELFAEGRVLQHLSVLTERIGHRQVNDCCCRCKGSSGGINNIVQTSQTA